MAGPPRPAAASTGNRYRAETARAGRDGYSLRDGDRATEVAAVRAGRGAARRLAAVALAAGLGLGLAACQRGGRQAPAAARAAAPTVAATTAPATTGGAPPSTRPPPTTAPKPKPKPAPKPPETLRQGATGPAVADLQRRLAALGYQVPAADGEFGSETAHAVVAFQKVNRLGRDGVVGPRTRAALARPRLPSPRARAAYHLEADLTLQVVYVVRDGRIAEILDASSASGRQYTSHGAVHTAVTPLGSFRVQRKLPGWRKSDLGLLWKPAYFDGGYAVHGSPSVPPFPASHGCIRLTMAAMDALWPRLPVGTPVLVYRS
jgi:peptidoglycan hydrolase-like protein with peptidoglycan-binding domain